MFSGAHVTMFSHDAEADRAFFHDKLGLSGVDAGGGWMIFALPPAEIGFHPAEAGEPTPSELYLMCEDVEAVVGRLRGLGVEVDAVSDQGWGLVTRVALPSGGSVGIYQARHARPGRG